MARRLVCRAEADKPSEAEPSEPDPSEPADEEKKSDSASEEEEVPYEEVIIPHGEDRMLRCLSGNREVAILTIDATDLVKEAQQRHSTAPTATAALGRALVGALLLSCTGADDEALQFTFVGNGIANGIQVIAESTGCVKGKIGNPLADLPLRDDGKLDVGGIVGKGTLAVVRTQAPSPVPYTGTVEITSGEIAEDLAVYMAESEQTNSAIALGVQLDSNGLVSAAGGYMIQALPFASDETLSEMESNLNAIRPVSDLLGEGIRLEELVEMLMDGVGVDEESYVMSKPTYGPCEKEDLQKRMKRAAAALGQTAVEEIFEQEGKLEMTCEFCNDTFQFSQEDMGDVMPFAVRKDAKYDLFKQQTTQAYKEMSESTLLMGEEEAFVNAAKEKDKADAEKAKEWDREVEAAMEAAGPELVEEAMAEIREREEEEIEEQMGGFREVGDVLRAVEEGEVVVEEDEEGAEEVDRAAPTLAPPPEKRGQGQQI